MQHMSARDAKNGFGRLIDLARAKPIAIEKYGRSVVIVMAVEEYERLSAKAEKEMFQGNTSTREGKRLLIDE